MSVRLLGPHSFAGVYQSVHIYMYTLPTMAQVQASTAVSAAADGVQWLYVYL